ncbi:MAG: gluconokinase, GntK/IdnK-type [Elainellaceae cyanobacterium]
MGVAGSGKTVVGRQIAQWLECDFLEGDRRHSPANIAKMQAQIPLDDGDRRQWLLDMQDDIQRAIALRRETVITCSALKRAYRAQLAASGQVQLVWLDVPLAELERRLSTRLNHYMKLEMLRSQIAAFEAVDAEENVIRLDGSLPLDAIVADWLIQSSQRFPALNLPWWQRLNPEILKSDP